MPGYSKFRECRQSLKSFLTFRRQDNWETSKLNLIQLSWSGGKNFLFKLNPTVRRAYRYFTRQRNFVQLVSGCENVQNACDVPRVYTKYREYFFFFFIIFSMSSYLFKSNFYSSLFPYSFCYFHQNVNMYKKFSSCTLYQPREWSMVWILRDSFAMNRISIQVLSLYFSACLNSTSSFVQEFSVFVNQNINPCLINHEDDRSTISFLKISATSS